MTRQRSLLKALASGPKWGHELTDHQRASYYKLKMDDWGVDRIVDGNRSVYFMERDEGAALKMMGRDSPDPPPVRPHAPPVQPVRLFRSVCELAQYHAQGVKTE